jgi:hypothetical protein
VERLAIEEWVVGATNGLVTLPEVVVVSVLQVHVLG